MSLHRFFCSQIVSPVTELAGPEARHLSSVLRLKKSDRVELFDGAGKLAQAVIDNVTKQKILLRIENTQQACRPQPPVVLAPGIAKGRRFDGLIEKCAELGVDRITPVLFERTVKQPANPKIVNRWQNIAVAACKQSGSLFLPEIDAPLPLSKALEILRTDYPNARLFFGNPAALPLPTSVSSLLSPAVAFIGPEGGFTDQELKIFDSAGATAVCLTKTILRVETAAIAFAAILALGRFCYAKE